MRETKNRKADHINIAVHHDVQSRRVQTGFADVALVHKALPEIAFDDVDTSTVLFGHRLAAPLTLGAMTGGTDKAATVNATLARAAEALGVAMGVGSQRVALEDPRLVHTFRVAREQAPNAFLIGNIGAPQLVSGYGLAEMRKAVEMIDADALAIHLNPLQEAVQPEGNRGFQGVLAKIGEIVDGLSVPVIVKETGAGIAAEVALRLESVGVEGIDVSGVGGTSWAAVESYRERGRPFEDIGRLFWDWGIPTVVSLVEVRSVTTLTVLASGGVRTGVDVAKALSLGADAVSIALPLLKPTLEGRVEAVLHGLLKELKTAMFLMGAASVADLQRCPVVITGKARAWLRARGFMPDAYARRGIHE